MRNSRCYKDHSKEGEMPHKVWWFWAIKHSSQFQCGFGKEKNIDQREKCRSIEHQNAFLVVFNHDHYMLVSASQSCDRFSCETRSVWTCDHLASTGTPFQMCRPKVRLQSSCVVRIWRRRWPSDATYPPIGMQEKSTKETKRATRRTCLPMRHRIRHKTQWSWTDPRLRSEGMLQWRRTPVCRQRRRSHWRPRRRTIFRKRRLERVTRREAAWGSDAWMWARMHTRREWVQSQKKLLSHEARAPSTKRVNLLSWMRWLHSWQTETKNEVHRLFIHADRAAFSR